MVPRMISYVFGVPVFLDVVAIKAALSPESARYRARSPEKPCKLNLQSSWASTEYVKFTGGATETGLVGSIQWKVEVAKPFPFP